MSDPNIINVGIVIVYLFLLVITMAVGMVMQDTLAHEGYVWRARITTAIYSGLGFGYVYAIVNTIMA